MPTRGATRLTEKNEMGSRIESGSCVKLADLTIRPASKADLSDVLRLYAQPALDDGRVISGSEAERIFERMARYPDYTLYVAVSEHHIVGTFALLVMDNLGHLGTCSGVVGPYASTYFRTVCGPASSRSGMPAHPGAVPVPPGRRTGLEHCCDARSRAFEPFFLVWRLG